jgi:tetratricopeptide (TPR) repeat protein
MVTRPVALLLLAGLSSASALAQEAGKAMLDTTRQPSSSTQPPNSSAQPPPVPINSETRGDIFMARKEYREAIETYAEGAPKNAVLDNKMGIAYHQLMDLDRARKCYEKALKLKPGYFEAINNLGTVYYAKKSYRRAIVWYGEPPGSRESNMRRRSKITRRRSALSLTFSNTTAPSDRFWRSATWKSAPNIISFWPNSMPGRDGPSWPCKI